MCFEIWYLTVISYMTNALNVLFGYQFMYMTVYIVLQQKVSSSTCMCCLAECIRITVTVFLMTTARFGPFYRFICISC